jgi:hypothetical protein
LIWPKKLAGIFAMSSPQQIAHLRKGDEHRNAVGEADHHAHWHVSHQRTKPEQAHEEQQHAGAGGGNKQVGHAVAFHDAVDDDDEGAGRPTNLHGGAAQGRDEEARDDGGPQTGLGLESTGNGKSHGEGQRHDTHRGAGTDVAHQLVPVVALHILQQARPEGCKGRQSLEHGACYLSQPFMRLTDRRLAPARLN